MEKRLVLVMALSLLVLLFFQKIMAGTNTSSQYFNSLPSQTEQKKINDYNAQTAVGMDTIEKAGTGDFYGQEEITEIKTDKYILAFSNIGGSLKKIILRNGQGTQTEEVLFDQEEQGPKICDIKTPAVLGLEKRRYALKKGENCIEYKLTIDNFLEITKKYSFQEQLASVILNISIKNLSLEKIIFSYQITGPIALKKTSKIAERNFLQADMMINGKIQSVKSTKEEVKKTGNISWVALKNRYFTIAFKPFTLPNSVSVQQQDKDTLLTFINNETQELSPNSFIDNQYLLYAGSLNEKKLLAIGYNMEKIVDYGFFGGMSKMLLSVLGFFQKVTKNWGIAIILLTIAINAVLFPLTFKSFSSMHQMKKIQPHMQKLKELHKDNPHKLNKEMMELYKKYNVNPLGGCLPLVLQMPIFIALYQGLMRAVDLKGANFLWIKDLANPDAVALPFSLPGIGQSINILPILMMIMMLVQQKISQGMSVSATTEDQMKQQKIIMIVMPIFFGFLFYNMPSGLVLYWFTNTVLMTIEQNFISRQMA